MTTEIKKTKTTKEMAVSLKAENDELKAELKNLSEWIIEMGTYANVDIQRDFDGEFDEYFIEEVATCLEDDILSSKFNLERQDKIIKNQDESIEAQKIIIHNSNLIILMLASHLATKYNDEIGKAYLEANNNN
ncbi:hypothetical protein [Bacillus sp. 196mf]|uniref:hypothetical protein n=1 Tax=Bacillus sp. 196mf TaxID=1761754 RepID=UPI000D975C92|nr:hypothetical protein [Bacillus sp. 196mf]PYE97281.1 hypothetical protein ATL10_100171 [Bacillus sp. 196mf]